MVTEEDMFRNIPRLSELGPRTGLVNVYTFGVVGMSPDDINYEMA